MWQKLDSRRTRIAFVDARPHSFYGAQRSLFTLVTNLPERDVEPLVLLPSDGVLADHYRRVGVNVHVLPLNEKVNRFGGEIPEMSLAGKLGVTKALLEYNWRVSRWLKKRRIDIVYANDLRALLYVGLAGRLTRRPVLWYVRADGQPSILSHLGLRLADRVILIADGVRSLFTARDNARFQGKFVVLHTGFALDDGLVDANVGRRIRDIYGIPRDAIVIGIVASVTQRKGHDLLIAAIDKLQNYRNDIHLMIVGDVAVGHENYRAKLAGMIDRFGLQENVHWVGYQEKVSDYYNAMDLVALPSRSEGLPRTIIEALGMGLPVVATDVGGVREILTSEILGRVVPPEDVESLARAIKSVINTPDFRTKDHQLWRQNYVKERFSIDAYVQGFMSIINAVDL